MTEALKPSEVLSRAADLIEPEGAWTTGAYARGSRGRPVFSTSPAARCWCALGAITHELRGESVGAVGFMHAAISEGSIIDFNDHPNRSQAEVVAALRKASELARSEGQ